MKANRVGSFPTPAARRTRVPEGWRLIYAPDVVSGAPPYGSMWATDSATGASTEICWSETEAVERAWALQARLERMLEAKRMMIPEEYLNKIITGDARILAEQIPDESVDLIFTDPVYENIDDYRWLAETAARVLKPDGHLLAWQATPYIPETTQALGEFLVYRHTLSMTRSNVASLACRAYMYTHWTPCFWYAKTKESRPATRFRDSIDDPFVVNPNVHHKWHKPMKTTSAWLRSFTRLGDVVADFFVGGGTTAVACKLSGRNYIAFEIDPDTASRARARVEQTQTMHPVFLEEQGVLF